jgi:hypothetical protein
VREVQFVVVGSGASDVSTTSYGTLYGVPSGAALVSHALCLASRRMFTASERVVVVVVVVVPLTASTP